MTDLVLSDALLRSALAPSPTGVDASDLAEVVRERIRRAPQRGRRALRPWLVSPAATFADMRRAQLIRLVLAVALMAAAAGAIAAGARLLPPPAAPPQWILLQNGQSYSVPIGGGDRRELARFAGLNLWDLSMSHDGARISTVRGPRNEIFEVWEAAWVFAGRDTQPATYAAPGGVRLLDAGTWRPDGTGIVVGGTEHGASRIFLLDLATGAFTQLSPDGMSVDDWQPSPDGKWLEVLGQRSGTYGLYVLDLETRELRTVLESDGRTIPRGGALGWSPDSTRMTVRLDKDVIDGGIWALSLDGSSAATRLTPVGQDAYWMNFSPDGAWIMFDSPDEDQGCRSSTMPGRLNDTWVVRPDGSEPRIIARAALPIQWSDDSRSVLVESQLSRPDAPHGGVIRAFVDGSPAELVYAYTEADRNPNVKCHPYGVLTKMYRGVTKSPR